MNVKEALAKDNIQPAQKEPTLEQLKQLIEHYRAEADELKKAKASLSARIESLTQERETQSQRIYQLQMEIANNALGEADDDTPKPPEEIELEPVAIEAMSEGISEGKEVPIWKQKIMHPAAPFVVWGMLMSMGVCISPSIRADIEELGLTVKATVSVMNDVISMMTIATPFPEIGTMLLLSLLIAVLGIFAGQFIRWLIKQVMTHYDKMMRITIAAFPLLPISFAAMQDTFQNVNGILVMIVIQLVFIILQVLPREKKLKPKKLKRK